MKKRNIIYLRRGVSETDLAAGGFTVEDVDEEAWLLLYIAFKGTGLVAGFEDAPLFEGTVTEDRRRGSL